jgi:uncharacterized membrane protein YfcA
MVNFAETWHIPAVFAMGIFAGCINTLAGGGSLITLPVLILFGLPANIANGTNRLAITVQSIFAVAGFMKKGISNYRFSILISAPTLGGTLVGAQLAVDISDILFKKILAGTMLFVLGIILLNPLLKKRNDAILRSIINSDIRRHAVIMTIFFFIGVYGGFIQAGIGFILIAALTSLCGLNLVETNSQKVFTVGISSFLAVTIFIIHNNICWTMGLALAAGNGLGGWIGSHLAVTRGERFIQYILTICIIALSAKLLYNG